MRWPMRVLEMMLRDLFRNLAAGAARPSLKLMLLMLLVVGLSACSSIRKQARSLVGADSDTRPQPTAPRYSDNQNMRYGSDRKYRRMTKSRMEDEADLNAQAGSLWVMEGQGSYLFAQNQVRQLGDLLPVAVEGNPRQQLQSKVRVISKLLERLEAPSRGLASTRGSGTPATGSNPQTVPQGQAKEGGAAADPNAAPGATDPNAASAAPGAAAQKEGMPSKDDLIASIQTVPTRVVEQLKDGSYRVKGIQPFMIGKREYKVIVTGIVRPEDFDERGIDSSKLLDSQFDIVSSRKGSSL